MTPADMLPFTDLNAIAQLCPNCGLCCDSTLFADVELRAADEPKRLAKLGLVVRKKEDENDERPGEDAGKGREKLAFAQPCACFDGKLCRIYADRPTRCRLFECGLLKKVTAGRLSAAAALEKISRARTLASRVRELLGTTGRHGQKLALIKDYTRAMEQAIDLTDVADANRRGELMLAMQDLMRVLQKDFLSSR